MELGFCWGLGEMPDGEGVTPSPALSSAEATATHKGEVKCQTKPL
jgi:hypothetical protein